MAFVSCPQGDLKNVFITEAEIIDRFVGDQLWMWGTGDAGGLGTNSTLSRSSPVQTVSTGNNWEQISLGPLQSAAIKTDGTLWLWGCGYCGRLGNNSTLSRSSPVQTVSTGANWKQVSVGNAFAGATKTDGTLWMWGCAANGRIGDGLSINKSSPVQTVSNGTNWYHLSLGSFHSAAIKTDGTLWMWGGGSCGELGNNDTINHSSPIQTVTQGTNWKQVSAGQNLSAAVKTDGTLWLWGLGSSGGLGNLSVVCQSSPVQTISTGTNWKHVSVSSLLSSAIKTDGTLWIWGSNSGGNLGDNSTINKSSPVQTISTGNNWKQVSTGSSTGAIKTDGTLWLWGSNATGGLGNNSTISQSSPVQTVAFGTSWKQFDGVGNQVGAVTFTDF